MSLLIDTSKINGFLTDATPYHIGFSIKKVMQDAFMLSFNVVIEENGYSFNSASLSECYTYKKGEYVETLRKAFLEFEDKTGIQLLKSSMKITA